MLVRALALLIVTLVVCWPTWSLPELHGTEGRRVQIAIEMVRSGDYMMPTLGHQPTWAKPPLHYWLLAACENWLGSGVLWWRLPSVLAVFGTALLAGELLRRWFGARAGWIGAFGIVCSPVVLIEWPAAEIDPIFASFTAVSLWCLATGVARERRTWVLLSGVAGGLAVLQKGPPYFLFAFGAYLVWWLYRRLRFVSWHLLPMGVVVLAYYLPLWLTRVAPGEMLAIANEESVGRLNLFDWHAIETIPWFWLRAVVAPLPFVLWLAPAWRKLGTEAVSPEVLTRRMGIVAAVVAVALLTLFPGRPTRYLLPNVLLITFATAPVIAQFSAGRTPLPPLGVRCLTLLGISGAVALVVLPFIESVGVGAVGFAGAAALGPLLVRTRQHAVLLCLALPVIGTWTLGLDRTLARSDGPKARSAAARLFERELVALGVRPEHMQTIGHFDSPLLLRTPWIPPGDESARGPWRARWVLHERSWHIQAPANYTAKVQLDLPFKSFVVCEGNGESR